MTQINLSPAQASVITLPTTFIPGQTLPASQLNNNFSTIVNDYNGNITNANIASGAAIAASKISFSGYVFSTLTATQIVPNAGAMTANQVLGENNAVTGIEGKTISGGTGLSVTPSAGAIALANTGVTSNVAGTGIGVSGATGAVTISNSGVTGLVAGAGIGISGATGNVTISASATGGVAIAHVLLSSSNLLNIGSTPITVIAAQGSGTTIIPVACTARLNYGGTAYTGSSAINIGLSSSNFFVLATGSYTAGSTNIYTLSAPTTAVSAPASGISNAALQISGAGGGSPATGNGTMDVWISYYVVGP